MQRWTRIIVTAALLSSAVAQAKWTPGPALAIPRAKHTATLLHDGRVLVVGGLHGGARKHFGVGEGTQFEPTSSTVLFDPAKGTWRKTDDLPVPRAEHTATLLADGRVLVAGGEGPLVPCNIHRPTEREGKSILAELRFWDEWEECERKNAPLDSAEIWDPKTELWSPAEPMKTRHTDPSALRLADGRVLVTGEAPRELRGMPAEVWDPTDGHWTSLPFPPIGDRYDGATLILLPDDRVMVIGGYYRDEGLYSSNQVTIWDPSTVAWSEAARLGVGRALLSATVLPDGRVFAVGGADFVRDFVGELNDIEEATPGATSWRAVGHLAVPRAAHRAVLLGDGSLLFVGGDPRHHPKRSDTVERWSPLTGKSRQEATLTGTFGYF